MLRISNVETYGWEAAIRGMRNPMNSWDKSDSQWMECADACDKILCAYARQCEMFATNGRIYVVGENDLKLMKNLASAGNDHSKFLRMIQCSFDLEAPLYFWKEFDTYKIGTVRNSCSTMHKIHEKEFTLDDFSYEHLSQFEDDMWLEVSDAAEESKLIFDAVEVLTLTIHALNRARVLYLDTKDKKYWWQMIQLLPSSYMQKATISLNYQVLRNIRNSERKTHKLDEWRIDFMDFIDSLPYAKELLINENTGK